MDAMAIQDEGSVNATKCDVEAGDVDILITGCSMVRQAPVYSYHWVQYGTSV